MGAKHREEGRSRVEIRDLVLFFFSSGGLSFFSGPVFPSSLFVFRIEVHVIV